MNALPLKRKQPVSYGSIKPIDSKKIIDAIVEEAKKKWGEDWFPHLVRCYCEIEGTMTGQHPTPHSRRSTLERAIATGEITLKRVTWLAAAVDAEIQLAVHHVEIRKF